MQVASPSAFFLKFYFRFTRYYTSCRTKTDLIRSDGQVGHVVRVLGLLRLLHARPDGTVSGKNGKK